MFYRAPPNLDYFDAPRELTFLLRIEEKMLRKATILMSWHRHRTSPLSMVN